MKKIFKRIVIAFSIYSRIPMPVFVWEDEDTRHSAAFLPLIGLVIGLLEYLFKLANEYARLPEIVLLAGYSLVPLIVTGGFHLDGFLDVEDAFSSYKGREEKLKILKDPHIGAFAVIKFAALTAFWIMGMSLLINGQDNLFLAFCIIFPTVRAIAGFLAQTLPHAKRDGMLNSETTGSKADKVLLIIQGLVCLSGLGFIEWKVCVICLLGLAFEIISFKRQMNQNFGGITGDTIGYFIVKAETVTLLLIGIYAFAGTAIK